MEQLKIQPGSKKASSVDRLTDGRAEVARDGTVLFNGVSDKTRKILEQKLTDRISPDEQE